MADGLDEVPALASTNLFRSNHLAEWRIDKESFVVQQVLVSLHRCSFLSHRLRKSVEDFEKLMKILGGEDSGSFFLASRA